MENIKLGGIKFPKKLIPAKNKPQADKVYTPDWLAEAIVNHYKPWGKCLEACAGGGAFVRAMEKFGVKSINTMEIDDGSDFLEDEFWAKYDFIVTNPPFSKFRAFLKKSMEVADNVVFLCTINHIFGLKARLRDIKDAGFYIREVLLCDTPESWPSSGFAVGAVYLSRKRGDCKISHLNDYQ